MTKIFANKSVLRITAILVVILFPMFFYSNCGKVGNSFSSSEESSYFPGAIDTDNPTCKAQANVARTAKAIPENIDEAVVVVDNDCVEASGGMSEVSRKLIAQGLRRDLRHGAYNLKVSDLKRDDLLDAVANDKCIHSINQPATYQLVASADFQSMMVNQLATQLAPVGGTGPNDTYSYLQGHLTHIGFGTVYPYIYNVNNGIQRPVKIAIVDSGVDMQHPDLVGNFLKDASGNPVGFDATTGVVGYHVDAGFHGTHVTGLAAAITNNTLGVTGVAGNSIQIISVKVGEATQSRLEPSISLTALVNGIHWAADQNVDVINISIGGAGPNAGPPALRDALAYAVMKGATVFIAAGNGNSAGVGYQIDNVNDANKFFPAGFAETIPGVIAVASVDSISGAKSSFSNYSPTVVMLASPGSQGSQGILSTTPTNFSGGYANGFVLTTGGTAPIQGTSMASPVAAGAAALGAGLLRSRGFKFTPPQLQKMMDLGSYRNSALAAYVTRGNVVNLPNLVEFIDAQTHTDTQSSQNGLLSYGTINILSQPQSKAVNLGSTTTLSVTTTSDSTIFVQYQWYKNGLAIPNATSSEYRIANVANSHLATYQVKLTAGTTTVTSANAVLSSTGVQEPPTPCP